MTLSKSEPCAKKSRAEDQEPTRPKCIDQATERVQAGKREIRNKGDEKAVQKQVYDKCVCAYAFVGIRKQFI
ncbi:hypothetical protein ACTXT7_006858 [Hymenolepis weldensis]